MQAAEVRAKWLVLIWLADRLVVDLLAARAVLAT